MGSCFSLRCRSTSSTFNTVRLVHLNGHVQDFDRPISVGEITGKPPKIFLYTAAQLVSVGLKPLNAETQLQSGHIYYALPLSTLEQDCVSPLDMACIVKRLTARAKSASSASVSPRASPSRTPENGSGFVQDLSEKREMGYGIQNLCTVRTRSWKPKLDTIRETSFTRRSESDIKEIQSFIIKK